MSLFSILQYFWIKIIFQSTNEFEIVEQLCHEGAASLCLSYPDEYEAKVHHRIFFEKSTTDKVNKVMDQKKKKAEIKYRYISAFVHLLLRRKKRICQGCGLRVKHKKELKKCVCGGPSYCSKKCQRKFFHMSVARWIYCS